MHALQEIVFPLLEANHVYPHILLQIEKIEALVDDEDAVKKNQKIEQFFTMYLMWYRDQHARKMGVQNLFFPEAREVTKSLPSLEKVLHAVDDMVLALQRNIKFSACLERLFL